MQIAFTDEQQFLREAARGVLERDAKPERIRCWAFEERDRNEPFELVTQQGWDGVGIDEDSGGQGGGVIERAILAHELGRVSFPDGPLWATNLAGTLLADAAVDPIEALIPTDAHRVAILTDARRPLDRPTHAEPEDGSLEVDFALGATESAYLLLLSGSPRRPALSLVASADATFDRRDLLDRTRPVHRVRAPKAAVTQLGTVPAALVERLAAVDAVLIAADALGAGERLLKETVQYVADRHQFGVSVGSFQAVQHAAVEMLVHVEATFSAVYYAAWALDAEEHDAPLHAWIAKEYASRHLPWVADKALFLHGAVGYTWEHDLQLSFKRIKVDAELTGGAGLYADRVADGALKEI